MANTWGYGAMTNSYNDMQNITLADQSAVALENARAYHALEAALRRVQILESIRANLAKFVPRVVQDLIERAPEAPALAKRDVDVSVLFVDIVGYSRLSDRLDAARLNDLVERYFGAFLDEILGQGGDVNETAGDGLMVIFQDPDPRRHAVAAALAGLGVLRRTAEINAAMDAEPGPPAEPIGVHVGVNSGVAAVGATRIEGLAGTRWTYTASGPVTNVAARLAALGEGTPSCWAGRRGGGSVPSSPRKISARRSCAISTSRCGCSGSARRPRRRTRGRFLQPAAAIDGKIRGS